MPGGLGYSKRDEKNKSDKDKKNHHKAPKQGLFNHGVGQEAEQLAKFVCDKFTRSRQRVSTQLSRVGSVPENFFAPNASRSQRIKLNAFQVSQLQHSLSRGCWSE
ncbi:unnamed protein product [Chondrus crispus]|uniref:Uncharacterized protein n=1 Tax=Chondrus crispus TaxID=2769 RepID=R7Q9M3_CHOCR|nr:unnamed protein product [Chondrus crispus]CDF34076.1 unnamed protein product [Chondrus crispus]|eukprot:XP_005713895.1 unnamed protein product [Chondrus crispus]